MDNVNSQLNKTSSVNVLINEVLKKLQDLLTSSSQSLRHSAEVSEINLSVLRIKNDVVVGSMLTDCLLLSCFRYYYCCCCCGLLLLLFTVLRLLMLLVPHLRQNVFYCLADNFRTWWTKWRTHRRTSRTASTNQKPSSAKPRDTSGKPNLLLT